MLSRKSSEPQQKKKNQKQAAALDFSTETAVLITYK